MLALLLMAAFACCKSASNGPQRPIVYDDPNNMVESNRAIPQPAPPELNRSCAKDTDCVPAPDCCPTPCTSDVINVSEMPKAQALLESCPKDRVCPSAGGCPTFAYLCVEKKCALVFQSDQAYRPRQSP